MALSLLSKIKRFLGGVGKKEWNSKSPEEKEEAISRNIDAMVAGMEQLRKTMEELEACKELNILKRTHENSMKSLEESKRMMEGIGKQIKTVHSALSNLEDVLIAKRKHSESIKLLSVSLSRSHTSMSSID